MKLLALILTVLLSFQVYASKTEETIKCTSDELNLAIDIIPATPYYYVNEVSNLCANHRKIQFEWEAFAFFKVQMGSRNFSGVGCSEDVNFEFVSAQKYQNESIKIWIYMDELDESSIIFEGAEYSLFCEYVD